MSSLQDYLTFHSYLTRHTDLVHAFIALFCGEQKENICLIETFS
jgi:hypothetical protein